jgi:hypothetical protein
VYIRALRNTRALDLNFPTQGTPRTAQHMRP